MPVAFQKLRKKVVVVVPEFSNIQSPKKDTEKHKKETDVGEVFSVKFHVESIHNCASMTQNMKLSRYILEVTVFTTGAVIMIFELVGSRVLGPYFGTSIFVWTSVIGIILGSLSLGYYLGGRKADNEPSIKTLSLIVFQAGIFMGFTIIIKDILPGILQVHVPEIRIASVIGSIILFSPASVFLGMVSPYAVRLKLHNVETAGSTIGNLYAISTLGSISGTFLSGFYLIPHFGTTNLLVTLCATMVVLSLILAKQKLDVLQLSLVAACVIGWNAVAGISPVLGATDFMDIDTAYNRVWIYNVVHPISNATIKIMGINNENDSAMFIDSDDLVNDYSHYFDLVQHFKPDFAKAVIFGGAGYSYPKYFLTEYPHATIDVVEIDPKVTQLAREHFRLKDDPRMSIFHQDGRVFLNTVQEQYDVIFGDAFSSHYSLPYQLTTQEAVQKKHDILSDDGVVILNIISSLQGEPSQFLQAEYITYKSIFPQVLVYPVTNPNDPSVVQNIMLIALKSETPPPLSSGDLALQPYLEHLWTEPIVTDLPILTDDFAPVDYYINKTI